MRQFSEFEKVILKDMVSEMPLSYEIDGTNYVSNSLGRIMVEYLSVIHISQIDDNHIKVVFLDKHRENEMSQLFDLVFLMKYLEDTHLLGLSPLGEKSEFTSSRYKWNERYNSWTREKDNRIGFLAVSTHTHTTSLGKEILRYTFSQHYVSQELKDSVANDFKSREQLYVEKQLDKAKRQTQFAFWTMVVAVLTFLATIIVPLIK